MKQKVQNLSISDFTYSLPADRIALKPSANRGESKLLTYHEGKIAHTQFNALAHVIDPQSHLVFNNTKVVQARIIFQNRNGRDIEIFCLEPAGKSTEINLAMAAKETTQWICLVGGVKKWKEDFLVISNAAGFELKAQLTERREGVFVVTFSWSPKELTFSEVLEEVGRIPLPPYIKRDVNHQDKDRYQTVFAKEEGSVAAPTAGLHFTDAIIEQVKEKGVTTSEVTLHVGAGTFKPVSSATMKDHPMHAEWINVTKTTLKELLATPFKITPVGTTSMRTLESVYWLGVKLLANNQQELSSELGQWDAYDLPQDIAVKEALEALIHWLEKNGQEQLVAKSRLIIAPGYTPKICQALITNFHQPGSTLLLLVAALVGDQWKKMYEYALAHEFMFLSYGDSNYIRF